MDIRGKRERPQIRMAYRIDDAAHLASISRSALCKDIRDRKIPIVKRNRSTRILHSDLKKYIENGYKTPERESALPEAIGSATTSKVKVPS